MFLICNENQLLHELIIIIINIISTATALKHEHKKARQPINELHLKK
jgi:hypothetical protein